MNKRFQEFTVGRKGKGGVNLATGDLIFTHQTTDPESNILPVVVSHVYSSKNARANNGNGWKLNLEQTLKPVSNENGQNPYDTKFIYTDACGTEYELEQRFFYEQAGERVFVTPNQVRIDFEGKLTLASDESIEVKQETRTREGLILQSMPNKNFMDFDKIEPLIMNEDLKQAKEEIWQLEKSLGDFSFNVTQFTRELSDEN